MINRFLNAAIIPKIRKIKKSHGSVSIFLSRKKPINAPRQTDRAITRPIVLTKLSVLNVFLVSLSIDNQSGLPHQAVRDRIS